MDFKEFSVETNFSLPEVQKRKKLIWSVVCLFVLKGEGSTKIQSPLNLRQQFVILTKADQSYVRLCHPSNPRALLFRQAYDPCLRHRVSWTPLVGTSRLQSSVQQTIGFTK